jgi:large subunit ribosomal protein L35
MTSKPPTRRGDSMKTHSGAKKRFRLKPGGKIKRKKRGLRHILSNKSSKRKRHLGMMDHVHPSDVKEVKRMLGVR